MLTDKDEKKIGDMITTRIVEALNEVIVPKLESLTEDVNELKVDMKIVKTRLEQLDRKVDHFVDKVQIHETRLKKLEVN